MFRILQSWRSLLASMLIFILLFSQTIRVDFLSDASASEDRYRDVVSIFVDTNTYSALRSKISRYAEDIQGYLGSTRVSVFVVNSDVSPAQIASKNEELYYEGDGARGMVTHLVGTILIGDIPVPMVDLGDSTFPSMYPYVDFVDKKFVYDDALGRYIAPIGQSQKIVEPEIWHGVMNPGLGQRNTADEAPGNRNKLANFLDKTHEFYTGKGVFAPSNIPPRVFYYDGYAESKSVTKKSLYQYVLNMENSENIAYRRYTQNLLFGLNGLLQQFDAKNQIEESQMIASLGLPTGTDSLSGDDIRDIPDIQTEVPIRNLLKDFHAIINNKTLGDELLAVRNAGRYNSGSTVRADLAATIMTTMDDTARSTLFSANQAIMTSIDRYLTGADLVQRIPILDTYSKKEPVDYLPNNVLHGTIKIPSPGGIEASPYGYNTIAYQNYFFGQKVSTLTTAEQCTIARGNTIGSGQFLYPKLVEANGMYDIATATPTANLLKTDTELLMQIHKDGRYACFDTNTGSPKARSYWGNNSLIHLSVKNGATADIFKGWPSGTELTGMTESIFDLAGMKETQRLTPASLENCISPQYQYALEIPAKFSYVGGDSNTEYGGGGVCTKSNLSEWNTRTMGCEETIARQAPDPLRYSCLSEPKSLVYTGTLITDITKYSTQKCLIGSLTIDGKVAINANKPCMIMNGGAEGGEVIDTSEYVSVSYHTLEGILRHISPTDAEIAAAKSSGATPSLPIDTIRYVEFVTPKGNIARIHYPNFFQTPATDIASFRAWLSDISRNDWNSIIAQENATNLSPEQIQAKQYLGGNGSIPGIPIDWNQFLSDTAITQILQARNWLTPDVSRKYTQSIEAALSYSRGSLSDALAAPRVPALSPGYEVAYLGLKPFTPESSNVTADPDMMEYESTLQEISALNISEEENIASREITASPSDQCGPPEGVDLFRWPQAVMCWIKSLTPMQLIGQACGVNTFGFGIKTAAPVKYPDTGVVQSLDALNRFYSGGKLTYHISQSAILLDGQARVDIRYEKDGASIAFPQGSLASLNIINGTDSQGRTLSSSAGDAILSVSPHTVNITDAGAGFLLTPQGQLAKINLQAQIRIPTKDGKEFTLSSDTFSIRIMDEFLDVTPIINGAIASTLPVTSTASLMLGFSLKNTQGVVSTPEYPITLNIYDDISDIAIATGVVINADSYTLPSIYTKTPGVLRLELTDHGGRVATQSLALTAGPLDHIQIAPVSSALLAGSDVPVFLRLQDVLGNPISPNLHAIELTVRGGYFLTEGGEKRGSLQFDSTESEIPFIIGSDTPGEVTITALVDHQGRSEAKLSVVEKATISLKQTVDPQVGGTPVPLTIQVLGADGNPLAGFRSVASLRIMDGAGSFSPSVTTIDNGVSPTILYTPGQIAGLQNVEVTIPGITLTQNVDFSIKPGTPMYISHQEIDGSLVFSIRDRYGNIVPVSPPAILTHADRSTQDIVFSDGKYIVPKASGYYRIDIPLLKDNTISYTDEIGDHTIKALSFYSVWIAGVPESFDFAPDYNARYTVLAGENFLGEGSDILYNTTPGSGQSLAVTTLLDSPYLKESIFDVLPGGAIHLKETDDTLPEASLMIEGGYPKVTLRDRVSQSLLANIRYHARNATLRSCETSCTGNPPKTGTRIDLISNSSSVSANIIGNTLNLLSGNNNLLSISRDGALSLRPGVTVSLAKVSTSRALTLSVSSPDGEIAQIIYQVDPESPVLLAHTFVPGKVTLESLSNFTVTPVFAEKFGGTSYGYQLQKPQTTTSIDPIKNGPEMIDSLGALSEVTVVGWGGSNPMMLSYAGGDTVGEATKWFHTFTMINLGDPVAHNDKKAPGTELEGMDRSIGTELTSPQSSAIAHYATRDMNKDGLQDVVVQHNDGYVELILNLSDRMRSRGNIAYIPSIVTRGFSLGDFSNDGYADILGVNTDGNFILLANQERQFSTSKILVQAGESAPTHVTQFKVYDMDADKKDDIVYLTEGGELGVLYGTATAGTFEKKMLDTTLGITLDAIPSNKGGAFYDAGLTQYPLVDTTHSTELDATRLYNEVYVPIALPTATTPDITLDPALSRGATDLENIFSQTLTSPETSTASIQTRNFIRSEYAEAADIPIKKYVTSLQSSSLVSGDAVRVEISIENKTNRTLRDGAYLDTIPAIFLTDTTKSYQLTLDGKSVTRDFARLPDSGYDAVFSLLDIPVGKTLTIAYDVTLSPMSYGELLVGDYEKGEAGADPYGDVGFQSSTTCGADMILWRSTAVRSYERGTRSFSKPTLGANIGSELTDTDNNGIPDSIDTMDREDQNAILNQTLSSNPATSTRVNKPLRVNFDTNSQILDIGFDAQTTANLEGRMREIADGLSCGFGGGACMNFPINWAPLAPGSAPVAFGIPLSILTPSTGLPVFSGLTGIPLYGPWGCIPIPSVYPTSPLGLTTTCSTNILGAGGMLGTTDPANVFRIYATPTLTLGTGVAFCFGGPSLIKGNVPPAAAWPLTPGGNCVVIANPISMCKDDGSIADGDVRGVSGLGSIRDSWNAQSCSLSTGTSPSTEEAALRGDIISYMKHPDSTRLGNIYQRLSNRTPSNQTAGPLIRLGGASSGGALSSIEIGIDDTKPLTVDNIIKIKNKRIAGYPDFIMEWLGRQIDQITNSLLSAPNLIIIPPTSIGQNAQYDGTLSGLSNTFDKAYNQKTLDDIRTKAGQAYDTAVSSQSTTNALTARTQSFSNATSSLGKWVQSQEQGFEKLQDSVFASELGKLANQGKGGLSAIRAAYKLIGKLPLISISEKNVAVNVPWILPQELDQYARALDAYNREYQSFMKGICANDPSAACLEKKAKLQSSGFINSLNLNLKRIEEYKNFPVKLQKYITWKQRYLSQILCYITEIQQMTTGWVKDNSIRFRKWAELIVLIKAVAKSWQPLLDIVAQKDAQCAVCHNERYNAKYWKYKIISALIPSIPVIQFPRWPDIVLDLHDIRFGIVLSVPNFQFNLNPIRLPALPNLSLPRLPNLSVTLPNIPILPPIPELPDLPTLPALPTIKLPNLPPPPKLPKLFASVQTVLKILKLFKLMECYLNSTTLVPEWTVGDIIAQRTERQGTFPFLDFIDLHLPQLSIPSIREIRVASHVNFEIRSDFISEFAQAAVAPINAFTADMGRVIPTQLAPDVNISAPKSIDINLQSQLPESGVVAELIAQLEHDSTTLVDQDTLIDMMRAVYRETPELANLSQTFERELALAHTDADRETKELLRSNTDKFSRITEYLEKQQDETAQLQNIVDLLRKNTSLLSSDVHRAQMASENTEILGSTRIAQEINQSTLTPSISEEPQGDVFASEKQILTDKLKRLAANNDFSSSNVTDASVTAGYSPNFQGIYILTPSGIQTRLFDYTAPLTGDEEVTKTDIDQDGDDDYFFVLDGALFLKRSTEKSPPIQRETHLSVSDLGDTAPLPTAPNFFHEVAALPKALNFSYQAASVGENLWKTEFYDRYLEWDMVSLGQHNTNTTPKHTIEIVDTTAGERATDTQSTLYTLDRVENPSETHIEGPQLNILEPGTTFTLGAGRTLSTGSRNTTIIFTTPESSVQERVTLGAASLYRFPTERTITIESGRVYIFAATAATETYAYSDKLIGMPIVPGVHIAARGGRVTLRDQQGGPDTLIESGDMYRMERVSSVTGDYDVTVGYPNGVYSARIFNKNSQDTTLAGESLLVAQASSDTSSPEWNLTDTFRIPVYQVQTYALDDLITETSEYSVRVDPDETQDSNGNGIYDDDFVTSGSGIHVGANDIQIGPFDTLGNKTMTFQIRDEFGNTSTIKADISVYAPVPMIQSVSLMGTITGKLNESLGDEPVHIFRIRPGSDIGLLDPAPSLTENTGIFTKNVAGASGALLSTSGGTIALSDNGFWSTLPPGYTSQVILASASNPLHFVIRDRGGALVYQSFFSLPDTDIGTDGSANTSRIQLQTSSKALAVTASPQDPNIPGGIYLTNESHQPLVALARDGNIYPIASTISATLNVSGSYPEITLFSAGTEIARVRYQFDFFFTAK